MGIASGSATSCSYWSQKKVAHENRYQLRRKRLHHEIIIRMRVLLAVAQLPAH